MILILGIALSMSLSNVTAAPDKDRHDGVENIVPSKGMSYSATELTSSEVFVIKANDSFQDVVVAEVTATYMPAATSVKVFASAKHVSNDNTAVCHWTSRFRERAERSPRS